MWVQGNCEESQMKQKVPQKNNKIITLQYPFLRHCQALARGPSSDYAGVLLLINFSGPVPPPPNIRILPISEYWRSDITKISVSLFFFWKLALKNSIRIPDFAPKQISSF